MWREHLSVLSGVEISFISVARSHMQSPQGHISCIIPGVPGAWIWTVSQQKTLGLHDHFLVMLSHAVVKQHS